MDFPSYKRFKVTNEYVIDKIDTPAYQWLWDCKLKSRDSFLMVIEFLPRKVEFDLKTIESVVICLSP